MKYLITNADDFGWGIDVTRGIVDSFEKGVLTSSSVIISEIDRESLEVIKNIEGIGMGLHLNIATGVPLTQKWREKHGDFTHPTRPKSVEGYVQENWEAHFGKYSEEDVFAEFEAQFALFKSLLGKNPDHLDTHYNTSSVLPVFRAYMKIAHEHSLPVRHPVKYPSGQNKVSFKSKTSELIVVTEYLEKLRENDVLVADYFSPEYVNLYEDYIDAVLSECSKVSDGQSLEISFHPGYREDWRRKQVEILTDPKLKKALREANVELINYYDLAKFK